MLAMPLAEVHFVAGHFEDDTGVFVDERNALWLVSIRDWKRTPVLRPLGLTVTGRVSDVHVLAPQTASIVADGKLTLLLPGPILQTCPQDSRYGAGRFHSMVTSMDVVNRDGSYVRGFYTDKGRSWCARAAPEQLGEILEFGTARCGEAFNPRLLTAATVYGVSGCDIVCRGTF